MDKTRRTLTLHRARLARIAGRWRFRATYTQGWGRAWCLHLANAFSRSARGCGLLFAVDALSARHPVALADSEHKRSNSEHKNFGSE